MNRASLGSARDTRAKWQLPELEGGPEMTIVAGFDVHRRQITFDALDTDTGELMRGRIDATPSAVERWAARFEDREVQVALEACTGWLFVSRALERAGAVPHLAEPVETHALRGRKRRAKTDREDARWLRTLLAEKRLPESWIPPEHVREWRSRARLRKTLIDERTQWLARIQATLFHHGVAGAPAELRSGPGREFLEELELPADARERIAIALAQAGAPADRLPCADGAVRHGRADLADDAHRAGRRSAPLGVAQGGADGRDRHRRASLRSALTCGQAEPPGLAASALGALRGRPVGDSPEESRP